MSEQKKISLKVLGGEEITDYSFSDEDSIVKNDTIETKQEKPKIKIKSDKLKIKPKIVEYSEPEIIEDNDIDESEEIIEDQSLYGQDDISGLDIMTNEFDNQDDFEDAVDETESIPVIEEVNNREYNISQNDEIAEDNNLTFVNSLKSLFKNIFNFTGKTNKKEYLFSFLWLLIFSFSLGTVGVILSLFVPFVGFIIPFVSSALSIANISLNCRRFNDLGMYWWTGIVPIVFSLIAGVAIVVLCIGSLPYLFANPTALISSFMESLVFISIGGLLLTIEGIWQLILFIAKDSDSFKDKKIINYILLGLIALGYIITIFAFVTGLSGDDINSDTSSNQVQLEQENNYTFGTEEIGYITSDNEYNFDTYTLGVYNFINKDYYVISMTDITSMLTGFTDSFGGDSSYLEDLPKEDMYEMIIEQYSETPGLLKSSEFTNKNNISGTLLTFEYNEDSEIVNGYKEIMSMNGLDRLYVFVTKDLKIVSICAPTEETGSMFDSYSYTGSPTIEITEEDIQEKSKSLELSLNTNRIDSSGVNVATDTASEVLD